MGLIKKTLQILITAGLLASASQAYRVGFAQVEKLLAPPLPKSVARHSTDAGPATLSRSAQEARELAQKAFGANHWAAHKDLKIRFYDAQRGFWIYAQNYDSKQDNGKKIRFWPVVFIWRGESTPDQKQSERNLIFGGGDEAIIEMSQSLGVIKPGKEPAKIVTAVLSGNVLIRDDKATNGLEDDLEIGPLSDIQFDEPTLSIHSKSDVRIKDRDLLITGRGLDIELWPRELTAPDSEKSASSSSQSNFTGTKTIRLASNVRIDVANVGKSNVLPGQARDKTTHIPAWLQCDGSMRIDMPRQNITPKVGPPRPPEPTIATFTKNVLLQRGREQPDQVTGDLLRAELFPKANTASETKLASESGESKSTAVSKSGSSKPGSGPMTELDLKWARVTGDKVTLKSQAQGLTAVGKELILKRPGGERADEVYLRGNESEPLLVERIEYARDQKGTATETIQAIENLTAQDVTIFDEKPKPAAAGVATKVANTAVDVATVVARGAGKVEVRNGRNQPVARSAKWSEQAVMITEGEGASARKIITLSGNASVWDGKSGTLDAAKSLIISLAPRGQNAAQQSRNVINNSDPSKRREAQASLSAKSYEIERVEAHENVHLIADNRFLNAKDRLDVEFMAGATANGQNIDRKVQPTALLVDANAANPSERTRSTPATPGATANRQPNPKLRVDSKRIWARLGPNTSSGGGTKGPNSNPAMPGMGSIELIEARLRGDVEFFQENSTPGKQPSQVNAQAVDVVHEGQGAYHLLAFQVDPSDPAFAKPELADKAKPVRVTSDQFELEGPILGLDQKASTAWVNGAGTIKQWIGSELLKQEGFQGSSGANRPSPAGKPQQATITWKKRMDFFGKPLDAKGNQLDARAHFIEGVVVRTQDALLSTRQLDTYFDQRIDFTQMQPAAGLTSPGQTSPRTPAAKPQIMFVDAKQDVVILNRRKDANAQRVEELQRVEGPHVMYDKAKDMVQVDGSGIVRLYQRREGGSAMTGLGRTEKKTESTASNKPFNLTRVAFTNGMQGRLGYDPNAPKNAATNRSADFFGDVQVINGQVSDEFRDLNVDKPPADFVFLSSEWLEVESLGDPANPREPRNLIRAKGTATARSANMSTQGDEIRFDSREELFHVIGNNGREVTLAHQSRPGQPPSIARGAALVYNNRSGESQLVDPKNILLVDPNSGNRPGLARSNGPATQPKPGRTPLTLPPSSNKERRSF